MNPLAQELNTLIEKSNPHVLAMLSSLGRRLYFPKGILSQSAEAKTGAWDLNATIGIATERGGIMHFPSIMQSLGSLTPENSITYAPSFGLPALRKQWQESLYQKNPSLAGKPVSLPVATCGVTHAVSVFADVWVDPQDLVILPDMFWGNYQLILNVRKEAEILTYPLFSTSGGFNLEAFAATLQTAASQRRKLIVMLNFPNNPTGYTPTRQEGARIVEILEDTARSGCNVLAVTDDAYFGLFYDDQSLSESLFAQCCNRHARLLAVKLDGPTKESYVWGLRVGFITYGGLWENEGSGLLEALEKKTAGAIRGSISNASHLSQTLVLNSLQNADNAREKQEKYAILKRRAQEVQRVLSDPKYHPAWEVYPFNSGYFMCIRLKTVPAEALRVHLLNTYGVGLIALGADNLRIAFSCLEESDVARLFDRILQGVKDLVGR